MTLPDLAVFGFLVNAIVTALLAMAIPVHVKSRRWIIERTAASFGCTVMVAAFAYALNARRFSLPIDRDLTGFLVGVVVVVLIALPLFWLATAFLEWWRAR